MIKDSLFLRWTIVIFFVLSVIAAVSLYENYTGVAKMGIIASARIFFAAILLIGFGLAGGVSLARQYYFGQVLELDQINEGEYACNKNTGWLITTDESNPRFIHVRQYYSSIEKIPLGMNFTLIVSTETGKETRSEKKGSERFTRRLFKANWKNADTKEIREVQWSLEV